MNRTFLRWAAAGLLVVSGVSCTTAYDSYGRPVQVVDPAAAAVGVAAAGVLGYALANRHDHHDHSYRRSYSRHHHHHDNYCW